MKKFVIALFLLAVSVTLNAQNSSYSVTLKKYMEASGSLSAFKSAVTSMMGSMRSMNSSVPEDVWKDLEQEFLSTSLDDLVTLLAPVYEKHLSEADLQDIIKFYTSPTGKKLAEKTPSIMQESMQAGQVWGQTVGEKVMKKLKEKGY